MLFAQRRFQLATVILVVLCAVAPTLFWASQRMTPQPKPSPNAPDQNVPNGMNGPPVKDPDAKVLDKQNQAEVRAEVEKLYALVFELREQMKQVDGTATMSVTVVKKAHQIEKLAKDIKDRAKN